MPRRHHLAAAFLGLALAACSADSLSERVVPADEADLSGVIAAIYIGPQLVDLGKGLREGHVLLVDETGAFDALETSGMHGGELAWSDDGLFFSDTAADYRISSATTLIDSPKTEVQDGVFTAPGGTEVAIYNYGAPGDDYKTQVVVTGPNTARSYLVTGQYTYLASCGSTIYGFTLYPEGHARRMATGPHQRAGLLLAQLYPQVEDDLAVRSWDYRTQDVAMMASTAVCREGRITALVETLDDRKPPTDHVRQVGTWDTATGRHTMVPLVDPAGRPLGAASTGPYSAPFLEDYGFGALLDEQSVTVDGSVEWLAPSGHVLVTDPVTGVTRSRFDTGFPWRPDGDLRVDFTAESIWVLARDPDADVTLTLSGSTERTSLGDDPGRGAADADRPGGPPPVGLRSASRLN